MRDHPELTAWVHAYTSDLLSWAIHRVSDRSTAEDLVQETFLIATERYATFRRESQPRTWLFGILNNKIADHFRTRSRTIPMDLSDDGTLDELFDARGRWKAGAIGQAWTDAEPALFDDASFVQVFHHCIDALPEVCRHAIAKKFLEEKGTAEVCQELGLSTTNYWQILHRSKLRLRACLERGWFHNPKR